VRPVRRGGGPSAGGLRAVPRWGQARRRVQEGAGGVLRGTAEETAAAKRRAPRAPDRAGCTPCFPAGTLVATPRGLRPIQTLHVGDKVLAEDPKTHKVEAAPLQAVRHDPAAPLMAIDLSDSSTITTTLTHAFWVDAGDGLRQDGCFYAEHLRVGDQLRRAGGAHVLVVGLRYAVGRADVYTLTVARDHTFFVGTAQVLVHNASCRPMRYQMGR
jgi:Pretoxin HINT domain